MKLRYRISRLAQIDLEAILTYTGFKWSEAQATSYYRLIIARIEHLCANPELGKSVQHLRPGYRVAKVQSHLTFYRIRENCLEVIRILHERMDILRRLTE